MDTSSELEVSIVVPVWNGAERLPRTVTSLVDFASRRCGTTEIIFVDDHSSAETAAVLEQARLNHDGVTVLRNARNRGKGYSVAAGVSAARGRFVVFTDADLAYPPEDIEVAVRALASGSDVVVACRVLPDSRYFVSPLFFHYFYTRHLMSRAFNRLVRWT